MTRRYKLTSTLYTLVILAILYAVLTITLDADWQPLLMPLATLLAYTFAMDHSRQNLGWRRTWLLLGLTTGISLLFESIGVATGWIYGEYSYTTHLGPRFLGLVPWIIPPAWFMVVYPSLVIALRLVSMVDHILVWRALVAGCGAVVMTAWDLVLDPLMVASNHWNWHTPGAYFGIPLQNYAGWWLTSFVIMFAFLSLSRFTPDDRALIESTFERQAILVYAILGMSTVATALRLGLDGPALVGLFAMTPWAVLAWRSIPLIATQKHKEI